MSVMTRRTFGKLLAAGTFSAAGLPAIAGDVNLPDVVAGYAMTFDEKELARRFLDKHEEQMAPLRQRDLPNGLAPATIYESPAERNRRER